MQESGTDTATADPTSGILSGADTLSSPCFQDANTLNPSVQVWVTLLGRKGCCLCDDALLEIVAVVERLKRSQIVCEMLGNVDEWLRVIQRDVDENQDLKARFQHEIPVLFINGRQNSYWRVDRERLFADIIKAMKAEKILDEIRLELLRSTQKHLRAGVGKRKFKRRRK